MSREPDQVRRFAPGDRVRVDIPDEAHPDHRRYHGRHGEIIAIIPEDATDEWERRFRVDFDAEGYADLPFWHLRPPISI